MSYENPINQRTMVLDEWRNSHYERALASLVTPSTVVLDAGSGLGVLGFLAASLGAKKVYMVEPTTNLDAARLIAHENNLADRVEFVSEKIGQTRLPEKVDIITSVFTGNFLLEEDLLPILFHARDAFLKDSGVLLPGKGKMKVMPVDLQDYYDKHIGCWKSPIGKVDHSSMHRFAVNNIYYDTFEAKTFRKLAHETTLCDLDFYEASEAACDAVVEITVTESGRLHGFLGWFDMLFQGEWLSTGPEARATHWSQAFLPIDPVVQVTEGDHVTLKLKRPENGEWSWVFEHNGIRHQHSTFLSRPFKPSDLERKSDRFQPALNREGQASKFLLERFDGLQTQSELAAELSEHFPELFSDEAAALRFVTKQVEHFSV
jgi:predicted RNA methylase